MAVATMRQSRESVIKKYLYFVGIADSVVSYCPSRCTQIG